jgi:hypothetical protein
MLMLPNLSDSRGNRINTHKIARPTPKGREAIVRAVVDKELTQAAADRFNTAAKTVPSPFRAEVDWLARPIAISPATVGGHILRRLDLNRLSALEPVSFSS